jgi:antirestriction protein ArdC
MKTTFHLWITELFKTLIILYFMETKQSIQQKRTILKELSKIIKPLVKEGAYTTVNEALIQEIYAINGNKVFKTYEQWKQEGKQVKKGEKAYLVWGKPKGAKEEEESPADEEKETFFPICFLFSNLQVN